MQARKIKYDVIGLTETRRHHPLHAAYDSGEELFLGTCDCRGVGGVGVLVNTHLAMDIDSYESLTTRVGRLRLKRCGSVPALTLEKFYKEDHTFYKVIVGDFNGKIGPRRSPEELHIGNHGLEWNEQGERLSEFIMSTNTIHGNSQFQKPPSLRWTWESPGGREIPQRDQPHHLQPQVLPDRRFRCPQVLHGIGPPPPSRKVPFSRQGEKAVKFKKKSPRTTISWGLYTSLAGLWEDSVTDNIDEEYDHFVHHLRYSAKGQLATDVRACEAMQSGDEGGF
ncbi:unnamed protein product [Heligmosomoides polygyrus]|uniref:Endo/exonuclease/phosphatase domain-containing protein n=1 Tax=Heligmosomoides polygyrus TaxID=6339 RepID=A0A183FVW6_HELPZ|nr:unnamed protein product [Heligmosomoides polygyrus]